MITLLLAAASATLFQPEVKEEDRRRGAQGSVAGLMADDDYPADAARRGAQGTVGIRFEVGRDGRVSSCTVIRSSGHADLDSRTCEIVRERGRFDPARDRSGRAVSDTLNASISWRLADEGPDPMRFAPFRMASTIASSGDGTVSCRIELNGEASPVASGEECRLMLPYPGMELPSRPGAQFEFTVVAAFTPAGAAPVTGPRSEYGSVVGLAEAELTLSQEGQVENCRVTEISGSAEQAPDFCEFIRGGGAPQFETAKAELPRTGRLRVTYYMRIITAT